MPRALISSMRSNSQDCVTAVVPSAPRITFNCSRYPRLGRRSRKPVTTASRRSSLATATTAASSAPPPTPSRSATPGLKPSISTSARATSRSTAARPLADFKSSAAERRLRPLTS